MRHTKPLLLVQDNPEDALALQRALEDLGAFENTIHAPTVEGALAYLRSETNQKPALILLDVNQLDAAGIEFLKTTKSDPALGRIPVVVLSASPQRRDVLESFELNVAGYIVKPAEHAALVEAVKIIEDYWSLSYLPACRR
ncbi:MAG: response regulator [Planctomycetes bacterium]|nr:response regulator [Planctomycetota bacterium]